MNKKISIVIPYYNKINWIDQTLKSIFDQTYKNYEILIIYDDTLKKDLKYLKKKINNKKIKLIINSKNLGAGPSRNKAVNFAKGEYIAFLDADDIWKPNKLKLQLAFMEKFNLKISHTSYFIIDKNNKKIGSRIAKNKQTYKDLLNSCDIGLSSVVIEKKLFLRNKFTSNKTKEDYALWLKISKKLPIYGFNKNLLLWRKTNNSLSSSISQKLLDAFDIYYRKEKFNSFNSLYRVIILSINYLFKKIKQSL
tara:strand:- start:707 stop:1459 length:753 start_codon:yes stop_codon:yes gene_type:complete